MDVGDISMDSTSKAKKRQTDWLRCLLFSVNLIAFVFGLVLFFLALTLLAARERYAFDAPENAPIRDLSAWSAAAGVAVCLVSFLGE